MAIEERYRTTKDFAALVAEIDRLRAALAEKDRLLALAKDEWERQDAKRTELEAERDAAIRDLDYERERARQVIEELIRQKEQLVAERDEARSLLAQS